MIHNQIIFGRMNNINMHNGLNVINHAIDNYINNLSEDAENLNIKGMYLFELPNIQKFN